MMRVPSLLRFGVVIAWLLTACTSSAGPAITSSAPGASSPASPPSTASTSRTTSVSASPVEPIATVTLSEAGCEYSGPAVVPSGPLTFRLLSEVDGQFDVHLWLLGESHEYEKLAAHIDEERRRSEAGEEALGHPSFARLVTQATDAGPDGLLRTSVATGTYGFACILFTEDAGGIWAAGPFEVTG